MAQRRFAEVLLSVVAGITQLGFAQTTTRSDHVPNASEQSAALAGIREYALNYTQQMPDFACTRVTRWRTTPAALSADGPGIQQTIEIESKIGFVNHQELEKIITIDVSGRQRRSKDSARILFTD